MSAENERVVKMVETNVDEDSLSIDPIRKQSSPKYKSNFKEVKVIKMNNLCKSPERKPREEPEIEKLDNERTRVVQILMDHGVSSAKGLSIIKQASETYQNSTQAIESIKKMVEDYQHEIDAFVERITIMEAAEVERLSAELSYQEELASNGGKPLSFFKVPALHVARRYVVKS